MNHEEATLERVFLQALEQSTPETQAAYLEAACAGNLSLLKRVRELLIRHHEPHGPLDSPPRSLMGEAPAAPSVAPTVIGRYKILEQIGEGGMGVVYLAEQTEPVKRKVALKIIKPGMDTRQVIARFDAERQALAMMDHPHTAKILDAGTTDTGHPYFVMELVRGLSITDYCNRSKATIQQRLDLFIKVCRAVQHAHQKGIIHRDLKPNNVLVTLHDGVPVPKVIDFGIAKAINQELTEQTLFTNFAQMVGTPMYVSPEQAELSGLDIDTRTDVYSLGVLLYELLTGSTPFDRDTLKQAGHEEVRRIIREEQPPKPSSRLSTLSAEAGSTVSAQRCIAPRKLNQQIRRELDWIVMKALEKDRTRRYESASALAADVQRYLAEEPVEACPPSLTYRLRKRVQRNRSLFATACLIFCFLLLSTIGLGIGMFRISQERVEALRQRNVAHQYASELLERERTIRSYLYVADIQLAFQAYDSGDLNTARQKLQEHRPASEMTDQRGFEWYYLWNLCQDRSRLLRPHEDAVYDMAFSSDGRWLASAGDDESVVIWDVREKSPSLVMREFPDDVNGLEFSADGMLLATAEEDGVVRIWDWKSGKVVVQLADFQNPVAKVFFTADAQQVVVTEVNWQTDRGRITLWDLSTQTQLAALDGLRGLAVDRHGKLLAACDQAGELTLWSLPELQQKSAWQGHPGQVLCAAFGTDGRQLATGSRSGQVKLWEVESLIETQLSRDHAGAVRDVAISPDGRYLASVGDDGVARIWDVLSATPQRVLKGNESQLWSVSFSPNSESVVVGSDNGSIATWNLSQLTTEYRRVVQAPATVAAVAIDSVGRHLAFSHHNSTEFSLVDAATGSILNQVKAPDDAIVSSLDFAPDDAHLWLGNKGGKADQWNLEAREFGDSLEFYRGMIGDLALSPSGRYLAVNAGQIGRMTILKDTESGGTILTIGDAQDRTSASEHTVVGFLSERILLTRHVNTVYQWNIETGAQLPVRFTHESWALCAAISPDKKILATATHDRSIHLWELPSGEKLAKLSGHRNPATCLTFSPDGQTIACATVSGAIRLWHVPTRQHLLSLRGHRGLVRFLQFSADGTRLFSAADTPQATGEIHVWDAPRTSPPSHDSARKLGHPPRSADRLPALAK